MGGQEKREEKRGGRMGDGRMGEGSREGEEEGKKGAQEIVMHGATDRTHTHTCRYPSYPSFCQLAHTVLGVAGIWQTGQKTSRPFPTSLNHLKNKQKKHFLTKTGNISEYVDPHGLAGS